MTLENCSMIMGLHFFLFSFSVTSWVSFFLSFIFLPLWACVVIAHVSVCRHPLSKSCGIWGRKLDMCGMGCLKALPTHFMSRPNSGHMVCPACAEVWLLLSGGLFYLAWTFDSLETQWINWNGNLYTTSTAIFCQLFKNPKVWTLSSALLLYNPAQYHSKFHVNTVSKRCWFMPESVVYLL